MLAARLGALPGGAGGDGDDWGNWRDDQAREALAAHACCLVLGVGMVYYLARADEMVLREHFKCQHLGAHLFQAVRPFGPVCLCLIPHSDLLIPTPTQPTTHHQHHQQ